MDAVRSFLGIKGDPVPPFLAGMAPTTVVLVQDPQGCWFEDARAAWLGMSLGFLWGFFW